MGACIARMLQRGGRGCGEAHKGVGRAAERSNARHSLAAAPHATIGGLGGRGTPPQRVEQPRPEAACVRPGWPGQQLWQHQDGPFCMPCYPNMRHPAFAATRGALARRHRLQLGQELERAEALVAHLVERARALLGLVRGRGRGRGGGGGWGWGRVRVRVRVWVRLKVGVRVRFGARVTVRVRVRVRLRLRLGLGLGLGLG
jgi:hypothetical protein